MAEKEESARLSKSRRVSPLLRAPGYQSACSRKLGSRGSKTLRAVVRNDGTVGWFILKSRAYDLGNA
jgi:hypothetical protein